MGPFLHIDPNDAGHKPFDLAVNMSAISKNTEAVALAFTDQFHCDTSGGTPYIHRVCRNGCLNLVRALVNMHGTDILSHTSCTSDKPLHVAAREGRVEVAMLLIEEYGAGSKHHKGRSLLVKWVILT